MTTPEIKEKTLLTAIAALRIVKLDHEQCIQHCTFYADIDDAVEQLQEEINRR